MVDCWEGFYRPTGVLVCCLLLLLAPSAAGQFVVIGYGACLDVDNTSLPYATNETDGRHECATICFEVICWFAFPALYTSRGVAAGSNLRYNPATRLCAADVWEGGGGCWGDLGGDTTS
jgi:hypothetical protein